MYRFILYDIDDFFVQNGQKLEVVISFYYYVCGIFLLIIILNLLLAILFDTFDKVISQ